MAQGTTGYESSVGDLYLAKAAREAQTTSDGIHRIAYIDGLRALAVLGVVMAHTSLRVWGATGDRIQHLMREGVHGVDLFFVISGFCLAYPTLSRIANGGTASFDAARYAANRIIRIVPPYFIATLIGLIAIAWFNASGLRLPEGMHSPATLLGVIKPLVFFDRDSAMVNASFWTLAVEFRWYFIFPVALWLWTKNRRAFLATIALVAIAYLETRARSTDTGVLLPFCLGIVAASVAIERPQWTKLAPLFCLGSIGLGLLMEHGAAIPGPSGANVTTWFQPTILGWQLAAFFFVVACGRGGLLTSALSLAPIVAIGVASYSIYLVHEPIVSYFSVSGAPAAGVLIALGAGFAFWAIVERPFAAPNSRRRFALRLQEPLRSLFAWCGIDRSISYRGAALDETLAITTLTARTPHNSRSL